MIAIKIHVSMTALIIHGFLQGFGLGALLGLLALALVWVLWYLVVRCFVR